MPRKLAKPASPTIKEPSPSSSSGQYPGKPGPSVKGGGMKQAKPTPSVRKS